MCHLLTLTGYKKQLIEVCSRYISKERLLHASDKIKKALPLDLQCRVSNPDFIPDNLIRQNRGNLFMVDNEFLSISLAYEYDLYNLSRGLDSPRKKLYLQTYNQSGDLSTYEKYEDYWNLCFELKRCRKLFSTHRHEEGYEAFRKLETNLKRYVDRKRN